MQKIKDFLPFFFSILFAAAVVVSGCAPSQVNSTAGGTLIGAGTGAATGAMIGALSGNAGAGAAIGAVAGAIIGGIAGTAHAESIKSQRRAGYIAPNITPPNTYAYSPFFQNGQWYCYDNANYPWWWDEESEIWRY